MIYRDFIDNGYAIFGLYGAKDGLCDCLNPKCQALFKHPLISNWQHTTPMDDEQLECGELTGQFETGYGVLCKGLLVIDVDARNGGIESYERLVADIPEIAQSGLIVETGSGGGSRHLFFSVQGGISLQQHLNKYMGIDFKSSGFVVGAGSIHNSGKRYRVVYGSPSEITTAPERLLELLVRNHTVDNNSYSTTSSSSIGDMLNMLNVIDPDCNYEQWYRIGMAIHHETKGGESGFTLWNDWSKKGKKYPDLQALQARWNSFGKSSAIVTVGTLVHYAEEAGYVTPVEFENVDYFEEETNMSIFDRFNPPALAGRIVSFVNSKSRFPRENLAVAAALMAISSACGLRYRCKDTGTTANIFTFGVAGSGTGKENILQTYTSLLDEAGIVSAVHGSIKSEQEIYRNITHHQAAFYAIDEMGEMLSKIQGARKKSGSAAYLEGIIGTLMSIYSKANGIQLITGDAKREMQKELSIKISSVMRKIENNEATAADKENLTSLKSQYEESEKGIVNPYLNLFGLTTPNRFYELLDNDMAENGFFARAFIFKEDEDNPRKNSSYTELDTNDREFKAIGNILSNMHHGGYTASSRIERLGELEYIPTSASGKNIRETIANHFWEMGEVQKETQGMVALTRRGAEMVNKLALILAIEDGEIRDEHLLWAFEFVKDDLRSRILIAHSNSTDDGGLAVLSKITSRLDTVNGLSFAVLQNKTKIKKEDLKNAIEYLLKHSKISEVWTTPVRGPKTVKYVLV
jgi:hypothetical protein